MKKIFTYIISMVAMVATACSEYQEVVDYEPLVLNSPESVEVEGLDNSSFEVSYAALSRVKMSADCDWIVVPNDFNGDARGTFTITTKLNPTVNERTGTLTVTANDPRFAGDMSYSKTITVTQSGGRPTISAYIESSQNTKAYTAPNKGTQTTLFVKTNTNFKVYTSYSSVSESWIKYGAKEEDSYEGEGSGDGYVGVTLTIAPNPNESSQYSVITISSEANGEDEKYEITVTHTKWGLVWEVNTQEINVDYNRKGGSTWVTMRSNLSWKATCEYDDPDDTGWVTLKGGTQEYEHKSDSKYTSNTISLSPTISVNGSTSTRTARIVIKCTEAGYTKNTATIAITQTGCPDIHFNYEGDYSVPNINKEDYVKFFSEVDWKASSNSNWLTIASGCESGSGKTYDQTLYFETAQNTGEARTAIITITAKNDPNVKATLQVVQDSAGTLTYKSQYQLKLTNAHFDVAIDKHTFDEAKGEGRVTFNGELQMLTDQPDGSTSVFNGATAVYLPYTLLVIGNSAFRDCTTLTICPIPNFVHGIGSYAFYGCESLPLPTIPASVTGFGSYAFYRCGCNTFSELVIPDGIKVIKDCTFGGCYITSLTLPDSVEEIGASAFANCEQLSEVKISANANLKKIGNAAFGYCGELKSITLPTSLTEIEAYAFMYCDALPEIVIPEGVTTIGDSAFYYCESLASITMPSSLTEIGNNAFYYCNNIRKVYISNIAKWCQINFIADDYYTTIYSNPLAPASAELYLNGVPVTKIDADAMGIKDSFGAGCFNHCSSIKEVYANGRPIGDSAFYYCQNITYVADVSEIGSYAFEGCKRLEELRLKSANIGPSAFSNCESLKTVTHAYGCNTKTIGKYAFSKCINLESYESNDNQGADDIGNEAFYGCTSLKSIIIGSGDKAAVSVGQAAFKNCISLENVEFRSNASSIIIDYQAFENCSSLKSLTFPSIISSGLTIISKAFYDCVNLAEVDLGSNIISIGPNAFNRTSGDLTITCRSISVPAGNSQMFPTPSSTLNLKILVPSKSVEKYKTNAYWKDYADYIVGY